MRLEGYSNYEIYPETGQVFSYKSNKFVGYKDSNNYYTCWLKNDKGKWDIWRLNRLIWTAVNGEITYGMEINHNDEDKSNNSISNLSLMTHKENMNWGTRTERVTKANINHPNKSKPVVALKNNELKMCFPSAMEAGRKGFSRTTVNKCCNQLKNYHTHKGYQWKFLDDLLGDWLEEIQDEDMKNERVA